MSVWYLWRCFLHYHCHRSYYFHRQWRIRTTVCRLPGYRVLPCGGACHHDRGREY